MESAEKQIEKPKDLIGQIFELEKQLDMMRTFIQQNESHSNESQDLKNKVGHFKNEVKRLTIELLQLRLKHDKENKI